MEISKRTTLMKLLFITAAFLAISGLALLSWVALPIFADHVKSSREEQAISELTEIIMAQNAYRSNPRKGNGKCAASLSELKWRLDNGSVVSDGPERYRFSTDKSCRAIAQSENPNIVPHPIVIMDQRRKVKFGE